jgi:hypothetical protein
MTAFSSQYPDYVHGPARGYLYTKQQVDQQGHIQAGAWVAGKQNTDQYLQVKPSLKIFVLLFYQWIPFFYQPYLS